MTIQDYAALGDVIGSLAVVVSLVYLAVQVRQNTRGIRSAAHQHIVSANAAVTLTPAQNLDFGALLWKGATDSSRLTEETQLAFNFWCWQYFAMIQATHQLYEAGAVEEALWQKELQRAVGGLKVPGFRQWWDAGGKRQLTPKFVSLVESTTLDIAALDWDSERGFFESSWTAETSESS